MPTSYARFEIRDVKMGLDNLRLVAADKQRKTMIKAVRAGARVIIRSMKLALIKHFRTGTLAKSIKSLVRYYAKRSTMVVMIGVSSERGQGAFNGKPITPYRYAHFVTGYRKRFLQECPRQSGRFRWIGANRPGYMYLER